jgi:hypothetical protein
MVSDKPSAEHARELAKELAALSKLQSEALQTAAYTKMSPEQASQYDHRRLRIGEICGLLGKFKPEDPKQ